MAFFDDIGNKITQLGQSAAQKTKEMTDIAKLNSSVSEEERKLANLYQQIGKKYSAAHENDAEAELAQLVKAAKDSLTNIEKYKKQIQDIKGVRKCEKCGTEIPANVAFCSGCGSPINKNDVGSTSSEAKKCPGCGASVSEGTKFCTSCGTKIV